MDDRAPNRKPSVLGDDDVRERLTPAVAVDAATRALVDAYRGLLAAPPRTSAALGPVSMVFTAGGYADGPAGFRAYGTWPGGSDQAVLVWGGHGQLAGVVIGSELGPRRTGALGAASAASLARRDARTVAVVGSGIQAWTQLWALTAVAEAPDVRVFSPTADHREAFTARARSELGVAAAAVGSAEDAVLGADVVMLATRAERPVIDAARIDRGAHVITVGPKAASAHEAPAELADRASVVVSDSPEQASAYGEPFFVERPLGHLGAVLCGDVAGRGGDDEITLYCLTGLAGSEVVIAAALLGAD